MDDFLCRLEGPGVNDDGVAVGARIARIFQNEAHPVHGPLRAFLAVEDTVGVDILADRDHDKIQSERHDMFKFVLVETLLNIAELGANINYYVIFFIIIS